MNTIVHAQLSTNEKPVSFSSLSSSLESIDSKIMPMLDMKKIEAEDMEDEEYDMPPRFGYSHIVSFDLHNSGTWSTMSNGDKLWQLRIICPNAIVTEGRFFCYMKKVLRGLVANGGLRPLS